MEMNIYEFLGVIIGDGCLLYYPKHRIYGLEITGNATEEKDYYEKISYFITKKFGLVPRIFIRKMPLGQGLKLIVYNKKLADFLLDNGITTAKTYNISIPKHLLDREKSKFILRGIFETDGSLYFSKSKTTINKPSYPRLEIKTASLKLANQILTLLRESGFNAHSHQNGSTRVVYLSGKEMLEKWVKEIGFNSNKNITKYLFWKSRGYYLPRLTLRERQKISENHQKLYK